MICQPTRHALASLLLVCSWLELSNTRALAQDDWKLDIVHLKNGNDFRGLVIEENDREVSLRVVRRSIGRPVVVNSITFKRSEVRELELLDEKERQQLSLKLKALATERQTWSSLVRALDPARKQEKSAFEHVELKAVVWGSGTGLAYQSTHFHIVSNARADLVALTAIQLEQIYAAYMRWLPPKVNSAPPTRILLPQSTADYQGLLRELGQPFLNTAYFDAKRNQIVCPSGLQRLADDWGKALELNQQNLKLLDDQEIELKKVYKGKLPVDVLKRLTSERDKLNANKEQYRKQSEAILQKLFQPLYHEAWHAYVHGFVYPSSEGSLPRWLNEGLAQVFELALLEAGELRVDHPDAERLKRAQALLKANELVSIAELSKAGAKQFLLAHNTEREVSDRYYLSAWAWAHYLTFHKKVLGTPAFDKYIQALQRGTEPADALRDLLGKPQAECEIEFQQYLSKLKPAGSGKEK